MFDPNQNKVKLYSNESQNVISANNALLKAQAGLPNLSNAKQLAVTVSFKQSSSGYLHIEVHSDGLMRLSKTIYTGKSPNAMTFFGLASSATSQATLIQFSDVKIAKNVPKYGSIKLLSHSVAPVYGDDDNKMLSGSLRVGLQDACKSATTVAHYDDISLETLLKLYADVDLT